MSFLNKNFNIKTNTGRIIMSSIFSGLIITIILYILIGPLNEKIARLLTKIAIGRINPIQICLIALPIFMIIEIIINLIKAITNENK